MKCTSLIGFGYLCDNPLPCSKHGVESPDMVSGSFCLSDPVVLGSPRRNWTVAEDGRSNSSSTFLELVAETERIIRHSADALLSGNSFSVARLILGNLAHKHGFGPTPQHPPIPQHVCRNRNCGVADLTPVEFRCYRCHTLQERP